MPQPAIEQAVAAAAANGTLAITHNPVGGMFAKGNPVYLYAQAFSSANNLLSYQWYRNTSNSTTGGTAIDGATSANLVDSSASSLAAGTYYYYVVATDTKSGDTSASATAAVKIVDKGNISNALVNGDFQDVSTFSDINQSMNEPAYGACYVCGFNLPGWQNTQGQGTVTHIDVKKRYQLFAKVPDYNKALDNGVDRFIELNDTFPSSVYQEVATVPGSIYSWNVGHAPRSRGVNTMAVVIGPALEGVWSSGGGSAEFPYGESGVNGANPSLFGKVVDKLAQDITGNPSATGPALGSAEYAGKDYTTTFEGKSYYVYIISQNNPNSANNYNIASYSGTYTVSEGQGATVFGFAGIMPTSSAGNVIDNISFQQGEPISASSDVDSQGNGLLSATTKDGYAYGILEVRGSTTTQVSGFKAENASGTELAQDATLAAAGCPGWYTPGAGTITFSNLTPGKTYRIVQVSTGAIGGLLGLNKTPANVLDENCYDDFSVKPVSGGSGSAIGNIQVTAKNESDGKSTLIVDPARSDVEYAVVAANAEGTEAARPVQVVCDWASSDAGKLSIPGLAPGTTYVVVGRPKGYDEITPDAAAASGTLITTPPASFKDVTPADVQRIFDNPDTIMVKNSGTTTQKYMVYDTTTKEPAGIDGWYEMTPGTTRGFAVDAEGTYQVVTCAEGAVPAPGVRSYPLPTENLAIDFVNETIPDRSAMPSTLQYRGKDDTGVWRFGGDDASDTPWVTGTGGARVSLTSVLDAMVNEGASSLKFNYKRTPEWTPSVGVSKTVEVPARPAAPVEGEGYTINYASADEAIVAGSKDIQVRKKGTSSWTLVRAGQSYGLALLGWTEKAALEFEVRTASVEGVSFASVIAGAGVPARAEGPATVKGKKVKNPDDAFSCSLTGVDDTMEYREWGSGGTWVSVPAGATTVEGVADGTYEVRTKATSDVPASFSVTASTTDAALVIDATMSRFADQPWGYAQTDASKNLMISNAGTADAYVTGVTFTGDDAASFELFLADTEDGSGLVHAGTDDATRILSPVAGLVPGTYRASAVVSYQEADDAGQPTGTPYSAAVQLVLTVKKASQDPPHDFTNGSTDTELAVTAKLPQGYALAGPAMEFSIDGGLTWQDGTASPSDPTSFTTVFGSLAAATPYEVVARMKGDANRLESAPSAATFYTAHTAPDASALSINYVAETVSFARGLEARSAAAGEGDALVSGGKVSAYLGADATTFSLRKAATDMSDGTVPASAWTDAAIPARPAAPADVSVTDADSSKASNGSIVVAGATALQYRKAGDAAWVSVNAGTISGLGAGTYEVRLAATSSSFASMSTTAKVVATGERYVTFMRNDGSTGDGAKFAEQTLTSSAGWKAAAPDPAPTRDHYTFAGWHEATGFAEDGTPQLAAEAFDFTAAVEADVVLYALWTADSYAVSFDANGGAFAQGQAPAGQTVAYDATAVAPGHDPARTGYAFARNDEAGASGWYVEGRAADKADAFFDFGKTLAENLVAAGATPPANGGQVVLKAAWTANAYQVTFDVDGAEDRGGAPAEAVSTPFDGWVTEAGADGAHKAPTPEPKRAGHTFAQWHLVKADGTITAKEYAFSKTLAENLAAAGIDAPAAGAGVTVRAAWSENAYTVRFTTYEGDTAVPAQQEVNYTKPLSEAAANAAKGVTRPGYVLDTEGGSSGWHIEGRAQGNTASFDFAKSIEDNLKAAGMEPPTSPAGKIVMLVAEWAENSYTLLYDEDASGDFTEGETKTEGVNWTAEAGAAPTDPVKYGYSFGGWYIPGRTTDAIFLARNTIQENYRIAGLPAPAADATVALKPYFSANSYTLLFDADADGAYDASAGDTQKASILYSTGRVVETDVAKPARQGFDFTGWRFKGAGADAPLFDFSKTLEENATAASYHAPAKPATGEATVELVPVFAAQTFTVAFDAAGDGSAEGDPSATAAYDAVPGASDPVVGARPTDPTRPGYTFNHWALEGAPDARPYDFAKSLEANCAAVPESAWEAVVLPEAALTSAQVLLRPVFAPNTYTVAFSAAGGDTAPSPMENTSFTGKLVAPDQEPKRPGYAFAGWHVATGEGASAEGAFDFAKTLAENMEAAGYDLAGTNAAAPQVPAAGGTVTLVAGWTANTYHVLFDVDADGEADAGEAKPDSAFNAATVAAPDPAPTLPGYTLAGWRLSVRAEGSTATYDFAKTLAQNMEAAGWDMTGTNAAAPQVPRASSTVALVPVWDESAYRLEFDAAGGTPEPAAQTGVPFASGVPADVAAPSRDEVHEFAGWHVVTGVDETGADVVAEVAFDLAKTIKENLAAAGYDTIGAGGGLAVPADGATIKLKAAWKVVAVSATVPLSVGVAVNYDDAGNRSVLVPAPGAYALLSTTQAPLKVTALACVPDEAGVAAVFIGGTQGVALSVNGASVYADGAGKALASADLPADRFTAEASPDGVVAKKLPLDLAFTVPDSLPMGYLEGSLADADTFARLTYTVAIDEGGSA